MKKILRPTPAYWWVLASYLLLTLLGVIFWGNPQLSLCPIIIVRLIFLLIFCLAIFLRQRIKNPALQLKIDLLLAYAFLGSVYKETAQLNLLFFNKIDPYLLGCDAWLFGGMQPSVAFSQRFPQVWLSELMFMGYFSYYCLPLVVVFSLSRWEEIRRFGFLLIQSFVIYYLIFIFLPAEGPQFFFPEPLNQIPHYGVFGKAVAFIQQMGEAPTAAFPSSHVGISCIILLFLWKHQHRTLFWVLLPFVCVLLFATVYIKAHYATDVLAGLLSAPIIYFISTYIHKKILEKNVSV